MIKWFIDNLKPLYYEKMIITQVIHFAVIPIREHINEGIRGKKIMGLVKTYVELVRTYVM